MQSELDALIAQEQGLTLSIQQEGDKVSLLRERMQDTHLVPSADQSVSLEALNSKVRCRPTFCMCTKYFFDSPGCAAGFARTSALNEHLLL